MILDEPELHLDEDVMVPDLAGWRAEALPEFPATAFFELAPDWVCEVLSSGTARLDRALKLPRAPGWGTPGSSTRSSGRWRSTAAPRPAEAVELDLSAWWEIRAKPG